MTTLGKFLAAKEPLFDLALEQLEKRTHKKGVDAALAAEIAQRSAERIRTLGLPVDCTGSDLYNALIQKVKEQDEHFAKAIGGTDPEDLRQMIPLIVDSVTKQDIPRRGFFLKTDVAAGFLRKNPPMKIMARLGYDTLDGLLENENIFEVFLALRFAEDAGWLNSFNRQYHSLEASDFEERDIELVQFDADKWGNIAEHFIQKKLHNITHSKEMGAIGVMPMTIERMTGVTLKVYPLLMHYYNEVRLYSAFFKLIKSKRGFGEIVAETLIADTPPVKVSGGQYVHWRVIQRYFGKLKNEYHPEIFEPHVHPEDLHWRRAEEVMYKIDPELGWWKDLDYVAVLRGEDIVTFNLMDVSLSYSNGLDYPDRYIYHFREALWNEIFARYMGEKTLEEQILVQLDNDLIAPERIKR
jgi:hypothetical protein